MQEDRKETWQHFSLFPFHIVYLTASYLLEKLAKLDRSKIMFTQRYSIKCPCVVCVSQAQVQISTFSAGRYLIRCFHQFTFKLSVTSILSIHYTLTLLFSPFICLPSLLSFSFKCSRTSLSMPSLLRPWRTHTHTHAHKLSHSLLPQ